MADCQKGISGIRENFWPAWVEIINDDYLWQKPVHALYLKYEMWKKIGNGNEYLIPRGPKTQIAGKHVVAWFRLQKCLKIIHIDVPNSFIEAGGSLHWPVSRLLLNRKVLWTQFRENKKTLTAKVEKASKLSPLFFQSVQAGWMGMYGKSRGRGYTYNKV